MTNREVLEALDTLQRQCDDKLVSTIIVSVKGAIANERTKALMDHVNAFALAELEQVRRERARRN